MSNAIATPDLPRIFITGDPVVEWRFARSTRLATPTASLDHVNAVHCFHEPGGATVLGRLVSLGAGGRARVTFRTPNGYSADAENTVDVACVPGEAPYWHVYNRCAQVSKTSNSEDAVWRVETLLGTDDMTSADPPPADPLAEDEADIVLVEDVSGALTGSKASWPRCIRQPGSASWLVLRCVARANLNPKSAALVLSAFRDEFLDRKVLVVTADELRLMGMRISRALSWERTAEDLVREVGERWSEVFRGCAHVVVSFLTDGAMVFSSTAEGPRARLYYDPRFAEGEWALDKPGVMVGSTRCLTAALILSMISPEHRARLSDDAIYDGVAAARALHRDGFMPVKENRKHLFPSELKFPKREIATLLRERHAHAADDPPHELPADLGGLRAEDVPVTVGIRPWSLIQSALPGVPEILAAARDVVELGDDTYKWPFPIARFGKFVAIDRTEIESMRAVRELIRNYLNASAPQSPISVAVFGAPGNGKTFAIKEISRELSDSGISTCAYNIAQFESPDAIHSALHQVQNITLSGAVPLVFWDEFDAHYEETSLGWLRFFLAPMQEGRFHQDQVTHNVGKAIFVFAGGTSVSKLHFDEHVRSPLGQLAKAPDFLSRLHGYVDIAGLNYDPGTLDAAVALRRAVRLRALLLDSAGSLMQHIVPEGKEKEKVHRQLSIDPGVLRAFLLVPQYKHGARSMEAIIKMSALSGQYTYGRSRLPPYEQLELHVNAKAFLHLIDSV